MLGLCTGGIKLSLNFRPSVGNGMRLYKDYKTDQDLKKKEELDRELLGVPQEAVIIYEMSKPEIMVKNIFKIVMLVLILGALGVGIIALAFLAVKA